MVYLSEDIIKYIIDFCDVPTLYSCCINKNLTDYIHRKDWKNIWLQITKHKKTALTEFDKKTTPTNDSEYKDIVRLAGFSGCMFCEKKNIRKVWWQFKIRSCAECIYDRTIGDWEFEDKLPKHVYENLPYTTKQMYNRYYGTYIIKFYWKSKINELLRLHPPVPHPPPPPVPLAQPKRINKIPTEQELETQRNRKEEINSICLLHNIQLNEAEIYSETYNKNIKVMSKLQKKNFIQSKIPEIQKEITAKKEEIRVKEIELENRRLENIRIKNKNMEIQQIQKEYFLMYKEDMRKILVNNISNEKNMTCDICKTNRLFCIKGLFDHRRDAHKIL